MPWPAWATERVELVESDPRWPARGLALAAELDDFLSPWLVGAVEHVGSTAVPGLPAKPVLDLMAAVPDPDAVVRDGSARLGAAGWVLVPPELDARPWRRFFVRPDTGGVRRLAHLHVMRPQEPPALLGDACVVIVAHAGFTVILGRNEPDVHVCVGEDDPYGWTSARTTRTGGHCAMTAGSRSCFQARSCCSTGRTSRSRRATRHCSSAPPSVARISSCRELVTITS